MITNGKKALETASALKYFTAANIAVTEEEIERIEIADFGLNDIDVTGLIILTYINTDRVCAKELVMTPNQTCPEHRHPPVDGENPLGGEPGKEETFRCRYGKVYLYVEGEATVNPSVKPPDAPEGSYTVFHEVILHPGEQYTIYPNTKHWFKSGAEGAVISEFSTKSRDESDIFSDKRIIRVEK